MKTSLLVLSLVSALSGCVNGKSYNYDLGLHPVDRTQKFFTQIAGSRFASKDMSLNFGSNNSFELLLNTTIDSSVGTKIDQAQCNIRVTGMSSYMQTPSGATAGYLQLNLENTIVLSAKAIDSSEGGSSGGQKICTSYAHGLLAEKSIQIAVQEYAADHLKLDASSGLGLSGTYPAGTNSLGIATLSDTVYLPKEGTTLDITSAFLERFNGSTYVSRTEGSVTDLNEATLDLNANLKELTITENSCGFSYIILIDSITTDGGTALVKGKVRETIENPPSNVPSRCEDLKGMLDGVTNQGIEIGGTKNQSSLELLLGKPQSSPGAAGDSIFMSFATRAKT